MSYTSLMSFREILSFREFFMLTRFDIMFQSLADVSLYDIWAIRLVDRRGEMNGGKITYHQQDSYCGKPRCRRCREGIGHGPYWYAYQTVNGRTVRTYVGKEPPAEMQPKTEEAAKTTSAELPTSLARLLYWVNFAWSIEMD